MFCIPFILSFLSKIPDTKPSLLFVCFLFIYFFMAGLAVSQGQLDRAKQSTKSAVLMNLESRVCSHLLVFLFG